MTLVCNGLTFVAYITNHRDPSDKLHFQSYKNVVGGER
jgi:hypothetical protein